MTLAESPSTAAHQRLSAAIRAHAQRDGIALLPFLTAGYPSKASFAQALRAVDPLAAAIEIGLPFSDPVADGATIQHSSRIALEGGASARWALEHLAVEAGIIKAPLVLMSYLNPLMALGDALLPLCSAARVCGLIVPDLPLDEAGPLAALLTGGGIGLISLATPVTPNDRLARLGRATSGFLYAVTVAGVTGAVKPFALGSIAAGPGTDTASAPSDHAARNAYLARCRAATTAPVCAGFGIRTPDHVASLAGHADGAIIGSALVEVLGRGDDPAALLASLVPGRPSPSL